MIACMQSRCGKQIPVGKIAKITPTVIRHAGQTSRMIRMDLLDGRILFANCEEFAPVDVKDIA